MKNIILICVSVCLLAGCSSPTPCIKRQCPMHIKAQNMQLKARNIQYITYESNRNQSPCCHTYTVYPYGYVAPVVCHTSCKAPHPHKTSFIIREPDITFHHMVRGCSARFH